MICSVLLLSLSSLTLKVPEKLLLYGLYVYYVVHICDFGMLRVNNRVIMLQIYCNPFMFGSKINKLNLNF